MVIYLGVLNDRCDLHLLDSKPNRYQLSCSIMKGVKVDHASLLELLVILLTVTMREDSTMTSPTTKVQHCEKQWRTLLFWEEILDMERSVQGNPKKSKDS